MEGWIKLHRKIQGHWLFSEKRVFSKYEAWIDILVNVNHSSSKIVIGNSLIICNRGQSLLSLDSWGKRWNWNKSAVRRFLILLEDDGMIKTENVLKTTRLTVCNYDDYQDARNANETDLKQEGNANETDLKQEGNANETRSTPNKNEKNLKNEKNEEECKEESIQFVSAENEFSSTQTKNSIESRLEIFRLKIEPFKENYSSDTLNDFWRYWTEKNSDGKKMRFEMEKVFDVSRRLITWSKNENKNFNGKAKSNFSSQSRQERIDEVREFRIANQQAIAERLSKYTTGDPK
ncbi:curlin repeat-containing protein [Sphingobacterium psychroaquaticum]|uniref:Uncharacterized protein n=1 Tax=Sphingobacterium psychroaquaticum TaxID=561061 RepID=A0A1X7JUA1_9SPHI|nr:curlin repeat-containing protein [Sphingobacterium psychroaquaticum]SMG31954.1 hypothetical protein SAMN05660862_2227 [Sphingobacterium psychroaquaticum]